MVTERERREDIEKKITFRRHRYNSNRTERYRDTARIMVVPDDHTVVAQLTAFERLTAGAIAGGTAKSIIAPADRVKM